jgi:membrane-bound ClpP family serine protease
VGPLAWAFILLFLAVCVVTAEMFLPSGGILAVLSTCLMIASIVMAFRYEPWVGLMWVVSTAIGIPILLSLAVQWYPKTAIGRRMLPSLPKAQDLVPEGLDAQELIGSIGSARSPMLPSGIISIAGETFDALSEGMPIDLGQTVRVVAVRGNRLIVRPYDGPLPERERLGDDALDQSLESLGIESLEDPLA